MFQGAITRIIAGAFLERTFERIRILLGSSVVSLLIVGFRRRAGASRLKGEVHTQGGRTAGRFYRIRGFRDNSGSRNPPGRYAGCINQSLSQQLASSTSVLSQVISA
jgi:hypothetical protein